MFPKFRTLLTLGTGAALAYFLDPANGARRREQALRRIQGDVAPQARGVARKVAESAPQLTSLPDAGELLRRARRPAATENAEPEPEPAQEG